MDTTTDAGAVDPVAAARRGELEALDTLFARHRRELLVHCYRMLGSFTEAEDVVQETFVRAMRSGDRFEGASSVRAWLYRIATNACLDELRRRQRRRVLPFDVMEPVRGDGPLPEAGEQAWIEPFPDQLLAADGEPDEHVVRRETLELVFLAAIQHLPPRQRVVFLARDVMGWSAKATAILLGTTEASVKSALQRARSSMAERLPDRREEWTSATQVDDEERLVVERYIDAHQQEDTAAMASVLAEDVRVAYPQVPLWSESRDLFVAATREHAPPGEHRFVVTSANLQPAVAIYHRAPGAAQFHLVALEVLRIEDGVVTEIVDFDPVAYAAAFGLEPVLVDP